MSTNPNVETSEQRDARRRRLEAVARWDDRQAHLHRRNGDDRGAERHDNNAALCRWRQR